MQCNRKNCKTPMQLKGFGRDKYYTCVVCGHLVYQNPSTELLYQERRKQCKNIPAAEG